MADEIALITGGSGLGGWQSASIDRSLDTLAGQFSVTLTEKYPGHPESWIIEAGADLVVAIGDEPVLTGYVDDADYDIGPRSHTIHITGRDKTCDLVDCSAASKPGFWIGRRLEQIAQDLCKPFGIAVVKRTDTGAAFPRFAIQQGETVFETIDRLCKQRGVLQVTNEKGELELIRPGAEAGGYVLELGDNVEQISFSNSVKDRYSDYLLQGHPTVMKGHQVDFLLGGGGTKTTIRTPTGSARDPGVTRYRPLVVVSPHVTGEADTSLSDRAKWEATTRAGKAQQVSATVPGWRTPAGELYRINRLVTVRAAVVGVNDQLLTKAVRFSDGEGGGRRTTIGLTRKEAYSLIDLPDPHAKKGKKKKGRGVDPLIGLQ